MAISMCQTDKMTDWQPPSPSPKNTVCLPGRCQPVGGIKVTPPPAAPVNACAVRIRALKRMAELVDEGQERGEIATRDHGGANIPNGVPLQDTVPATLTDLGITRQRLNEARKLEEALVRVFGSHNADYGNLKRREKEVSE